MGDTTKVASSFDAWYRAEQPRLLGLLTGAAGDADETFTRALERWDRVGDMASSAAWTYRVGVNLLRRRLRRAAVESRLWGTATAAPPSPAALDPDLWAAVRALPVRQRTAVALRYVCDLPQADLAAVMGVSPGTVSATLTSARRSLAARLEGRGMASKPMEVGRD